MAYTVSKLTDYSAAALEKAVRDCADACAEELRHVFSDADLKTFRDHWIARSNGILTQINDLWLKPAPKPDRPLVGQKVNWLKKQIEGLVEVAQKQVLLHRAP